MKKPLAAIIDISINNILSIKRTLEHIGFNVLVINEQMNIDKFDLIVLPGVGAFSEAMAKLKTTKLLSSLEDALVKNKNFLGICLGMQLLFENSEEFGSTKGISYFKGNVENFSKYKLKTNTFIGWNKIKFDEKKMLLEKKIRDEVKKSSFYFVHSCFVKAKEECDELGSSINDKINFSSIVKKNKVLAFQFHPEKSGEAGIILLKDVLRDL